MTEGIERSAEQHAASDWICQPPKDHWRTLTLGEQQRYCVEACRTKGAVYETKISPTAIDIRVKLPRDLELRGLTSGEAEQMERYLHRKIEDAIVWILREREARRHAP